MQMRIRIWLTQLTDLHVIGQLAQYLFLVAHLAIPVFVLEPLYDAMPQIVRQIPRVCGLLQWS